MMSFNGTAMMFFAKVDFLKCHSSFQSISEKPPGDGVVLQEPVQFVCVHSLNKSLGVFTPPSGDFGFLNPSTDGMHSKKPPFFGYQANANFKRRST